MEGEGKRWSAARATRPLHHLLHRCAEDVALGLRRDTICLLYAAPILQDYDAFIVLNIVPVSCAVPIKVRRSRKA